MKRGRSRSGGGAFQRIGLGLAAVIILTLTFTLGLLVGRQWWGRAAPDGAEGPRKPQVIARRGLVESEADRPRELQEKLTFYQTLTAPVGPIGQSSRARTEDKGKAAAPVPSLAQSAAPAPSALAGVPSASLPAPPAATATAWTVQVGAFKSRQQADEVQKRLTEAGFSAVLSPVTLDGGQSRYRVRVGGARSRGEAEQLAQQVRARLPLTTLVTAN
jgi:cell division septation protein DedD